ncbi:hypothetical protein ACQF4J_44405 [Streptomyces sp. C1-1]|uniref:hypothetical protein n=1 Tax=Streptomyces sp. C1-1 TaxID=3231173 RepID=UPI003D04A45A
MRVGTHSGVEVAKALPDGVEFPGGCSVPAGAVLWTGGTHVSPVAAPAGLTTDECDRMVTDSAVRSVSHPELLRV